MIRYIIITISIAGLYNLSCTHKNILSEMGSQLYKCSPEKERQLVKLPGWKNAWHITNTCDVANPADVSISMKIFYIHWLEKFGDPVGRIKKNLNSIMIMWGDKLKTASGYRMDGSYSKKLKAQGITYTKGTIWVKKLADKKICRSSLTHELVHAAIWTMKITDGDPDHLGEKYAGWTIEHSALIENVKEELCALGI